MAHQHYHLRTEKTWDETMTALAETMRKWGVSKWSVTPKETPPLRTYETQIQCRVTLRYTKNGTPVTLQMDKQRRAVDNLRVLFLAVEAMRLTELRGIAEVVREAYLQLPAPAPRRDPYEVLGVSPNADLELCEAAYRTLAKRMHPERGGDRQQRYDEAVRKHAEIDARPLDPVEGINEETCDD